MQKKPATREAMGCCWDLLSKLQAVSAICCRALGASFLLRLVSQLTSIDIARSSAKRIQYDTMKALAAIALSLTSDWYKMRRSYTLPPDTCILMHIAGEALMLNHAQQHLASAKLQECWRRNFVRPQLLKGSGSANFK